MNSILQFFSESRPCMLHDKASIFALFKKKKRLLYLHSDGLLKYCSIERADVHVDTKETLCAPRFPHILNQVGLLERNFGPSSYQVHNHEGKGINTVIIHQVNVQQLARCLVSHLAQPLRLSLIPSWLFNDREEFSGGQILWYVDPQLPLDRQTRLDAIHIDHLKIMEDKRSSLASGQVHWNRSPDFRCMHLRSRNKFRGQ